MVEYLSGGRIQGTSTDSNQNSWKELDRVDLTTAGTSMDTEFFAKKDNLMLLIHSIGTGSHTNHFARFNSDVGATNTNYAFSDNNNFTVGDTDVVSQTSMQLYYDGNTTGDDKVSFVWINNVENREKLIESFNQNIYTGSPPSSYSPSVATINGKWANTSEQIERVEVRSVNDNFGVDSQLVVLGCDNNESASGTNFWQLLGTGTASGSTISSGTIASKRFLMIVVYATVPSGTLFGNFRFNAATGGVYPYRNKNGYGTDDDFAGSGLGTYIPMGNPNISAPTMTTLQSTSYVVNRSGTKTPIYGFFSTHSGTNAPNRGTHSAKWTSTSAVTSIVFHQTGSGTLDSASFIKVYGAD